MADMNSGTLQNKRLAAGDTTSQTDTTMNSASKQNNPIIPKTTQVTAASQDGQNITADEAKAANTKSYAGDIRGQWANYAEQQRNTIDQKTNQDINKAQRTYEDSLGDYKKQYRDATTDMYQGMDNAALTADTSGRYGGMATAQVNSIQNDYQRQRQQLALQQQKLATDTAREIEDLRAQGEFDKADALLKARQQEFQALYEDAVRVDENQYSNWKYDNTLQREDEAIDREQKQNDKAYLQKLGQSFMSMGVMPSTAMLEAMGLNQATAQLYINAVLGGL